MSNIISFIKNEAVLIISAILGLGSMLIVKPSKEYLGYIDLKTLALLFCLMTIMAGFQALGVFKALAQTLLKNAKKSYQLYLIFILLCFLSSMVITNDVALITFVPFTIITLNMAGQQKRLIYFVAMETIAANLGSMLTPIGNPQNLFLFSAFNMSTGNFIKTILPYSAASLVLLLLGTALAGKDELVVKAEQKNIKNSKWLIGLYAILFIITLLGVFRIIPYQILLVIILVAILIFDRKIIAKVDYSLLFTFVFLFIFIGNLGNIQAISDYLHKIVVGNEILVGILASQVFSNVPACILLSGFTHDFKALLIGVNLGGLGTLIASMASLISFKFLQKEKVNIAKYVGIFTLLNIVFLVINYAITLI